MQFERKESIEIPDKKIVRVKRMNHILEVLDLKTENNGFNSIKKLNAEQYLVLDTGEVLEYLKSENRAQNIAGLKDTFKKIRDLINNNFVGGGNEIHLVTTYAENMTDKNRLYKDNKLFWQAWKRCFGEHFEFINIVEPQGRGAWHNHFLIKDTKNESLFIPWQKIKEIWTHGNIHIKTIKGVDNIGAYLSAYLADIEVLDDGNGNFDVPDEVVQSMVKGEKYYFKDVEVDGVKKKFVKGARCCMYPPGMNIYRKSKGILHPEVEKMPYYKAKEVVGSSQPNYSTTLEISDNGKILNVITYQSYNLKRLSSI